tara:strand:- start:372 stop:572 length:201 start_codon:yes stop_codon:yes gene_type:complete
MISESMGPFPDGEDPRDPMNIDILKKGTEMYSDYQEKRRRMSVEERLAALEDQMAEMMQMLSGMRP